MDRLSAWSTFTYSGRPIAPITGPMYQLFVFFTITDPRTTVSTRSGRLLVAVLIALVEMAIWLSADFQIGFLSLLYPSPPIVALFIVGPIAMLIDLYRKGKTPVT